MTFFSAMPSETRTIESGILSVKTVESPSGHIGLTATAAARFGCRPGDSIMVRAGSAAATAVITASNEGNFISSALLDALGLPATGELRIKQEGAGRLQIGPLIGIMVSSSKRKNIPPYFAQRILLKGFLQYSRRTKCLAYVFAPGDVDMVCHRVTGYFLADAPDGSCCWVKHTFPLPDTVYDRILYRKAERRNSTRRVTAYLVRNRNIKYFNPKFLNKWETYRILSDNPLLSGHLPETREFIDTAGFLEFLTRYPTVYLKPVHGSLGKGIIKISRLAEGYAYRYRAGKKVVGGIWSDRKQLTAGVSRFVNGKAYIMQQGLDLLKYRERVFDIRVLMQKNGRGLWTHAATVARVAMTGSIFPNVAAGGEPMDIDSIWQEITGTNWTMSATQNLANDLCLAAARTLDEKLGTFGEVGLDIGTDCQGNVWIIEINSKPSRKVFPRERQDLKKKSMELPVDFAAHLAGFSPGQE